ncbi:uncharacterized protein LOC129884287 [Solanum dulcamara]|uniref:uncharacterized protein LOC129884287 n=1 Tax=Solanum dulcamara TaxID=45834 RepID=UPI002485005D|nr:uncharacterized protein LOC129884287 [Solanum dulcamara]
MGSTTHVEEGKKELAKEVHRLACLRVQLIDSSDGGTIILNRVESSLVVETDGQEERMIQTLDDILRACIIDFKGNWDNHLPLIDSAYNNCFHLSIQMAPYNALYGRRCRSPIGWFEVGEAYLIGPDLVHQDIMRDLEFKVHDWLYLKVSPMNGVMRFAKKGNLIPLYIGPYQIMKQVRKLRTKEVASIKVLCQNQFVEEATWEAEEDKKAIYSYLFMPPNDDVDWNVPFRFLIGSSF